MNLIHNKADIILNFYILVEFGVFEAGFLIYFLPFTFKYLYILGFKFHAD
jgi:hypothetical protein